MYNTFAILYFKQNKTTMKKQQKVRSRVFNILIPSPVAHYTASKVLLDEEH
jgi:hypothetical protein